MKLHLQKPTDLVLIDGIEDQAIVIDSIRHTSAIALHPGGLIRDWQPLCLEQINDDAMSVLSEYEPQVVLLGTGATLSWPSPSVLRSLADQQIGVEVMDTRAACRTYNVLATEGRQVVAALLPIK